MAGERQFLLMLVDRRVIVVAGIDEPVRETDVDSESIMVDDRVRSESEADKLFKGWD